MLRTEKVLPVLTLAETKGNCPSLSEPHRVRPAQLLPAALLPAARSGRSHEPPVGVKGKTASFGKSPPLCTLPAFTKGELSSKRYDFLKLRIL